MKKLLISILTVAFLSIMTVPVCANSAPSYWEAYPYSEILAIDKSSPITVNKEYLIYDFSRVEVEPENFSRTPTAQVTAEYEMSNPTSQSMSVQMAFPLVSSLAKLDISNIKIKVDDVSIPFEIYPSIDEVNESGSSENGFRYDGFDISRGEVEYPGPNVNREGTLYRCSVQTDEEEPLNLEACFNADSQKTRLIGKNFNSVSYTEGESTCLGARFQKDNGREPEILILGEDSGLTFKVMTEDGKEADPKRYHLKISSDTVDIETYLLHEVDKSFGDVVEEIDDKQLMSIYMSQIWQQGLDTGYTFLEDVLSSIQMERVITLIYEVDFPADSTRIVRVGYQTDGTMDGRETKTPKYSYTYLLSPAKNWAAFGELNIKIITPKEAPFIINSSINFENNGQYLYSATLDGLPDSELDFTLYKNAKVSFLDKAQKSVQSLNYIVFFLWPFIFIAALAIAVIAVIILRLRR